MGFATIRLGVNGARADLLRFVRLLLLLHIFQSFAVLMRYNGKYYVVNVVKFYAYHINIPRRMDR